MNNSCHKYYKQAESDPTFDEKVTGNHFSTVKRVDTKVIEVVVAKTEIRVFVIHGCSAMVSRAHSSVSPIKP